MNDRLPPDGLSRPWYGTPWGTAYLASLGVASLTILFIALAVPQRSGPGREVVLLLAVVVLDALLPIPIAVGIFRRRFWRLPNRLADVTLGLVLFAPCLYAVWTAVFVVWFSLATIF